MTDKVVVDVVTQVAGIAGALYERAEQEDLAYDLKTMLRNAGLTINRLALRVDAQRKQIASVDRRLEECRRDRALAQQQERAAGLDADHWKARAQAAEAQLQSLGAEVAPTPRQVYEATR